MSSLVQDLSDGVRLIQLMVRYFEMSSSYKLPNSCTRKSWVAADIDLVLSELLIRLL